ncbi:unnamed protein product [Caenorhabditis angaria]|uniref:Uncharacterized protein n=1 Tax=Caenorhabditis angaria TaxID=860376 RepID=A0A9P1IN18_9PELO|nr:unnamed protein product [Caenorhabditis angaria]
MVDAQKLKNVEICCFHMELQCLQASPSSDSVNLSLAQMSQPCFNQMSQPCLQKQALTSCQRTYIDLFENSPLQWIHNFNQERGGLRSNNSQKIGETYERGRDSQMHRDEKRRAICEMNANSSHRQSRNIQCG